MRLKTMLSGMGLGLLSVGIVQAGDIPSGYPVPVQKVFRHWQITCNNLNDCDIRNSDPYLRVTLKREAGAQGKISLDFDLADRRQAFFLDGARFPLTQPAWQVDEEEGAFYVHTEQLDVIQQFFQAAKNAKHLTLSERGTNQEESISLNGLNAALLLMDERQGRLDNLSALLKVGEKDVSLVPSVPVGQEIRPAYTQPPALTNAITLINGVTAAKKALLEEEGCGLSKEAHKLSEARPLTNELALVMLNCGVGAYQSSSMLFITPRNNPQNAQLLELSRPIRIADSREEKIRWFTEVDYDPETGMLYHSAKGRGIADCGESGQWVFDGKGFQLVAYNYQPECNGGQPGDWPSVWATPGYPTE
ncbi:DUF1176 domain-containing protein [Musicola paradisiaca]|uniref:DUF1176 domain-containing protein n=1 Tax=Musicola paradisiaca (strain Ech703) TaxID=579405 RepID=C6C4S7_MUSP7|nr:DUF1176 domain-containing protein [Musicola paradisiaca]ACS87484.1 protein of unknown function DUF1176 [Musicola paradisiaca Ech703]